MTTKTRQLFTEEYGRMLSVIEKDLFGNVPKSRDCGAVLNGKSK